ncbi:hypothetical protein NMY22_g19290 [Coprinellus aureogranulatus]|nr:hypothetical protein NMY22_g19290 [Coprinellus aureogranulatus]
MDQSWLGQPGPIQPPHLDLVHPAHLVLSNIWMYPPGPESIGPDGMSHDSDVTSTKNRNDIRFANPNLARETRSKGKGPDAGNWGGVQLNEDERNVDVQQGLLDSFGRVRMHEAEDVDSPANVARRHEQFFAVPEPGGTNLSFVNRLRRNASRPLETVPPLSTLGMIRDRERLEKTLGAPPGLTQQWYTPQPPPVNVYSAVAPKVPINTPKNYDGSEDLQKYMRLRTEFRTYARRGRIEPQDQVAVLSYFLEGKAYEFYLYKASVRPEAWGIDKFMDALYSHCFSKDFQIRMRRSIHNTHQGNRTVAAYVHDLETKMDAVGMWDEKTRLQQLWDGFDAAIEQSLWRDRMNPNGDFTWDEIVEGAEAAEEALLSLQRKSRRPSQYGQLANPQYSRGDGGSGQRYNAGNNRGNQSENRGGQPRNQDNSNRGPGGRGSYTDNGGRNSGGNNSTRTPNNTGGSKPSGSSQPRSYSSRPRLSAEEEKEYMAKGKCFRCGEHGHLSRNCQSSNVVKSNNGPNKPPGLAAYNMEMEYDEEAEVLEDLPMYSIPFMDFDFSDMEDGLVDDLNEREARYKATHDAFDIWNASPRQTRDEFHEADWMKQPKRRHLVRNTIGDAVAMVAAWQLNQLQPYPGDNFRTDQPYGRKDRFGVYDIDKDTYVIVDRHIKSVKPIAKSLISQPTFRLGRHYAMARCDDVNCSERSRLNSKYPGAMGDAWSTVATFLLADGVRDFYPNINPDTDSEDRFCVQVWNAEADTFVVNDSDRETFTIIDGERLRNPHFNLIRWYQLVVERKRGFDADTHPLNGAPDAPVPDQPQAVSTPEAGDAASRRRVNGL